MLTELTVSTLVSAMIIAGLWLLRGMILTPVAGGKNQNVTVELRVKGSSPELENTVSGLLWLSDNGTLRADIVIIDEGMDEETRQEAGLLAKTDERVSFREWGRMIDT